MLHVPGAIVRWETPASVLFPLFTPNQPPVSGRRRSELLLWTNDIQSTRPNCLVHAEHEILIFLYFEPSGSDYDTALYLMVETKEDKQMHLIATKEGLGQYEPVVDWEQYFNGVLEAWKQTKKLPEGDCGYWRSWNEQQLAQRSPLVPQDGPPAG